MKGSVKKMNYYDLVYIVPSALIAITAHEFAHGYVSWKMGDPTPKPGWAAVL